MIQPLVDAGNRVLLFDQVGCGRSDKPDQESDYTYERHIGWNIDLLVQIYDLCILLRVMNTQSYSHHNATLSMSPSPTVGFGDAGAGGIGAAAAAWAA